MELVPCCGYVKDTGTVKGRGVFAKEPIEEGRIIEVCPVIQVDYPEEGLPDAIRRVIYHWGVLAQAPGVSALALGYGSLYNHANPANARYRASPDGGCLIVSAARRIERDEEITINYNAAAGEPSSSEDNWFAETGVELWQEADDGAAGAESVDSTPGSKKTPDRRSRPKKSPAKQRRFGRSDVKKPRAKKPDGKGSSTKNGRRA